MTTTQADIEKLGAVLARVVVTADKKLSNGQFGSNGAGLVLEASITKGADLDAVTGAMYAYAEAFCSRSLGAAVEQVREQAAEVPAEHADKVLVGDAPETTKNEPGEVAHVSIKKFDLLEKPDNKWELALYPDIKGKPGEWPEIKFVTVGRDDMWKMIDSVWDKSWRAPISKEVDWVAEYTLGREYEIKRGKNAGKMGRYKDLRGLHTA